MLNFLFLNFVAFFSVLNGISTCLFQEGYPIPNEVISEWNQFATERRKGTVLNSVQYLDGRLVSKALVKAQGDYLIYYLFDKDPGSPFRDHIFVRGPRFNFVLGCSRDHDGNKENAYTLMNIMPSDEASKNDYFQRVFFKPELDLLRNVSVGSHFAPEFVQYYDLIEFIDDSESDLATIKFDKANNDESMLKRGQFLVSKADRWQVVGLNAYYEILDDDGRVESSGNTGGKWESTWTRYQLGDFSEDLTPSKIGSATRIEYASQKTPLKEFEPEFYGIKSPRLPQKEASWLLTRLLPIAIIVLLACALTFFAKRMFFPSI